MIHKRTQIRSALAAVLTGLATCGARVFVSRVRPLGAAEVPALLIGTGAEDRETAAHSLATGAAYIGYLTCRVDIVVKEADGYEDAADSALADIEGRLFDSVAHNTLGGLVHSITLNSIGDPEMDDSTEKPVIRLPVFLRIVYSS